MTTNMIKNLAIWGDSLLKGIVFDETDGKYRPLKNASVSLFEHAFPIRVKNNSHFGCTAPKALANMERSLSKGFTADAVLLEFGGNDCDYNWAEVSKEPDKHHEPHTPYAQFVETMKRMAELLKQHGIRPIFMNLPPIDAERYFDWISRLPGVCAENVMRWLGQKDAIYRQQERYSLSIEKLAYTLGEPLIDVRDPFLAEHNYREFLCVDGIHLNQKGHEVMGSVFQSYAQSHAAV